LVLLEDGSGSYLLSGKLGTKKGCVNMRREEKQIDDYDRNLKAFNDQRRRHMCR